MTLQDIKGMSFIDQDMTTMPPGLVQSPVSGHRLRDHADHPRIILLIQSLIRHAQGWINYS